MKSGRSSRYWGRSQQRAIWTSTVGFLVGAILIDGTAGRPQFELLATSQLVVHQALPTVTGKRTQRLGDNIMGRTGRPNERRRLSETATTYVKRRGVTGHRLPIGRRSGKDCTFTISIRSFILGQGRRCMTAAAYRQLFEGMRTVCVQHHRTLLTSRRVRTNLLPKLPRRPRRGCRRGRAVNWRKR